MRPRIKLLFSALIGFSVLAEGAAALRAEPTTLRQVESFDFADHGVSGSLGVQVWPGEISPAALEEMHAVGVSAVRASLAPSLDDKDLPTRATTPDEFMTLFDKRDQSVSTRLATSFAKILKDNRLRLHLIFWDYPKPWQAKSASPGIHLPDMGFVDNYASLTVARLKWLQRFDIVPDYVELTNEPNGWWNTQYTPDQYARLLMTTYAAMKANGLGKIGIEGPGTDIASFDRFLAPLQRDGLLGLLAAYSLHVYDRSPDLSQLAVALTSVRHASDRKPIFITEFGSASPIWSKPPWSVTPLFNNPRDAHASRDFAVSSVADGLSLLAQGSETIFYWQLLDPPWGDTTMGLFDVSGKPKPVASAFELAFGGLRDAKVVAPKEWVRNPAVCFAQKTGGSCVTANIGNFPLSMALNLRVPNAGTCSASLESFSNDPSDRSAQHAAVLQASPSQGCNYMLSLPPRTVTRLDFSGGN